MGWGRDGWVNVCVARRVFGLRPRRRPGSPTQTQAHALAPVEARQPAQHRAHARAQHGAHDIEHPARHAAAAPSPAPLGGVHQRQQPDPGVEQRGAHAAGLHGGGGGGEGGAVREAVEGAGGLEGEGHGVPRGERHVGPGAAKEGEEEEGRAEVLGLARRERRQGAEERGGRGRAGQGVRERGDDEPQELRGPVLWLHMCVCV